MNEATVGGCGTHLFDSGCCTISSSRRASSAGSRMAGERGRVGGRREIW